MFPDRMNSGILLVEAKQLSGLEEYRKEETAPLRFRAQQVVAEVDIRKKMPEIHRKGFIATRRKGDTGVGYTLEEELGIAENNRRTQDLIFEGNRVELKAKRKSSKALVTLFTEEPRKQALDDKAMLQKYGYPDKHGRQALKVNLRTRIANPQGLLLRIDKQNRRLVVAHSKDGDLWFWNISKVKVKVNNLLLVFAHSKKVDGVEYFHYNEACYLTDFDENTFFSLIDEGKIVINLRMHLKANGAVRNRGTAFRGKFRDFKICYKQEETLIKT